MIAHERDLHALTLEPSRVLAVVAHPDDLEYGPSAAVAKWTAAGVDVAYLVATKGEAGIDNLIPEEAARVRSAEQIAAAAAAAVGVKVVNFLDLCDGVIEASVQLRRRITEALRAFQPDVVLLTNHREAWAAGELNNADHRAIGVAALDAIAVRGIVGFFVTAENRTR